MYVHYFKYDWWGPRSSNPTSCNQSSLQWDSHMRWRHGRINISNVESNDVLRLYWTWILSVPDKNQVEVFLSWSTTTRKWDSLVFQCWEINTILSVWGTLSHMYARSRCIGNSLIHFYSMCWQQQFRQLDWRINAHSMRWRCGTAQTVPIPPARHNQCQPVDCRHRPSHPCESWRRQEHVEIDRVDRQV